jgi:penicillin-binding protein 1C
MNSQTAESVPLLASTEADAQGVYWFVNESFVGTSRPGSTLLWKPSAGGKFVVRAVDDRGRADARDLSIQVVQ